MVRLAAENQTSPERDQQKPRRMVPTEGLLQNKDRKARKHDKRNHFLDRFKLSGLINLMADAIGGHSKAIFKEGDAPTRHDDER